jgi:hypothetical protein
MNVFDEALNRLNDKGFAPLAPLEKSKATYTLHSLVFDVLGLATWREVQTESGPISHIEADDSTAAFWDWKEVAAYVRHIYNILDQAATKVVGRSANAIGWAHDQGRKQSEIVELLKAAKEIGVNCGEGPLVVRRPLARSIPTRDSLDSAIGNTLAVLVGNGATYLETIVRLSGLKISNGELLDTLDQETKVPGFDRTMRDSKSLMPRLIVNAYTNYKSNQRIGPSEQPRLCTFFLELDLTKDVRQGSDSKVAERLIPWLREKDRESAENF